MIILRSNSDLEVWQLKRRKSNLSIGFVPTMGALHAGHLGLIEQASQGNDVVVCSIYVNPTQFNNREDLTKYPRTLEQDIELLSHVENVVVYIPTDNEVYPNAESKKTPAINLREVGEVLEAKNRPGHFEGVLTVVKRLFELIQPNRAYFGLKDYQQLLVIQMLAKRSFPDIEIIPCTIVRSENGLALSSRNQRLTKVGLKKASEINLMLQPLVGLNGKDLEMELSSVKQSFVSDPNFELEYLSVNDEKTLEACTNSTNKNCRVFIAVWVESIRLIDNMKL